MLQLSSYFTLMATGFSLDEVVGPGTLGEKYLHGLDPTVGATVNKWFALGVGVTTAVISADDMLMIGVRRPERENRVRASGFDITVAEGAQVIADGLRDGIDHEELESALGLSDLNRATLEQVLQLDAERGGEILREQIDLHGVALRGLEEELGLRAHQVRLQIVRFAVEWKTYQYGFVAVARSDATAEEINYYRNTRATHSKDIWRLEWQPMADLGRIARYLTDSGDRMWGFGWEAARAALCSHHSQDEVTEYLLSL
ncbi:MAG: hypothetical protein CMO43_11985 [Verrucomicrobiales bacterium]|nr:hypothetical protein [Verrucomicrobiales bacterium]